MKLILHVGCEKTGSTSLQSALTLARSVMADQGVLFARSPAQSVPSQTNHTHLVVAAMNDGVRDNIKAHYLESLDMNEDAFRTAMLEKLDAEIAGFSGDTMLLSSELIHSRLVRPGEIERLFSFFDGRFDDIKVVTVLRRQDRLATSRFSSLLRDGYTDFDGVFGDAGGVFYMEGTPGTDLHDYYDFRRLIERFIPFVGQENIVVGDFDKLSADGKLLPNMLDLLGLPPVPLFPSPRSSNPSMSAEAQYVLAKVNQHGRIWLPSGSRNWRFKRLQRQVEQELKGTKRHIPAEDARRFYEQFKESNAWVAEHFTKEGGPLFDETFDEKKAGDPFVVTSEMEQKAEHYVEMARALAKEAVLLDRIKSKCPKKGPAKGAEPVSDYVPKFHGMPQRLRMFPRRFRWKIYTSRLKRLNERALSKLAKPASADGKIVVARIIGNDHYPRHGEGQTARNLKFILEHEPVHERVTKLFVVNRIVDETREEEILGLVRSAGHEVLQIPFEPEEFASLGWQLDLLKNPETAELFNDESQPLNERLRLWLLAPKLRYLTNVNGARNGAISRGMELGNWVFPLDGNCIFTQKGLDLLVREIDNGPYAPYVVLPMARLGSNDEYFDETDASQANEEPQIGFHGQARTWFDDVYPYGILDKAHLLMALGVPGNWLKWGRDGLTPRVPDGNPQRYHYRTSSSFVLRLAGGAKQRSVDTEQELRYLTRNQSIFRTMRWAVDKFGTRDPDLIGRIFGDGYD